MLGAKDNITEVIYELLKLWGYWYLTVSRLRHSASVRDRFYSFRKHSFYILKKSVAFKKKINIIHTVFTL